MKGEEDGAGERGEMIVREARRVNFIIVKIKDLERFVYFFFGWERLGGAGTEAKKKVRATSGC